MEHEALYSLGRGELFINSVSFGECTAEIIVIDEVLEHHSVRNGIRTRDAEVVIGHRAEMKTKIFDNDKGKELARLMQATVPFPIRVECDNPDRGSQHVQGFARLVDFGVVAGDFGFGDHYEPSAIIHACFDFQQREYDEPFFEFEIYDPTESEEQRALRKWKPPKGVRRIRLG